MPERLLICRGCHRWWDASDDECECTCSPDAPRYEEWEQVASPEDVRTLMRRLLPGAKPAPSDAETEAAFRRLYDALPPALSPAAPPAVTS